MFGKKVGGGAPGTESLHGAKILTTRLITTLRLALKPHNGAEASRRLHLFDATHTLDCVGVALSSMKASTIIIASAYLYKYSPSARWGLRPQAPIWVLAKFGDKRSS
ncbi:hypothetical protein J6590_102711, partial [Homalodisca vitripennis]